MFFQVFNLIFFGKKVKIRWVELIIKSYFRGEKLSTEYSRVKNRDIEQIVIVDSKHNNISEKHYFIVIYDVFGKKLLEEKLTKTRRRRVLSQLGKLTEVKHVSNTRNSNSSKRFWLGYNEYGKKKKCFQNLSNIKLGLKDYLPNKDCFEPSDKLGLQVI